MSEINLKKNIAYTTSSQAITMAASFIANWYLARFLGPELRGQYVYLFTINSVVWLLLDFGVSKSLMYSLQREKANPSSLYSFSLVFFGVSLLLSLSVFYFFGNTLLGNQGYQYDPIVLLALGFYISLFQIYSRLKVISIGINNIRDYSLLLFVPTVAFAVLILPAFWLFPHGYRVQGSYLLNVCVLAMVSLIFHFRLCKQIKFRFIWDPPVIKRSYMLGFKAFLSEYMAILMTRVDILILKQLSDFAKLGVYTLAINFIDVINVTSNMIGVVLLNKFAAMNDDTASLSILRKIFLVMIVFNTICITGMAVLGSFVIRFMYGADYHGAYYAFLYLIPAIFGLTLGSLFNTFLWSKGFPVFTIIAPAISAGIKALLSLVLIPKYGYYGAAASSSLIYVLWFGSLMVWYFATHREQSVYDLIVRKGDIKDMWSMIITMKQKVLNGR